MTSTVRLAAKCGSYAAGLILLTLSALFSNLHFQNSVLRLESPIDEPLKLPTGRAISTASLNYNTFAADICWIIVLVDSGESLRTKTPLPFLIENGNVLADLDPQFRRVYDWVPNAAVAQFSRATENDISRVNDLIDRGIHHFPTEGDLPFSAAMNYIGYSAHASDARRLRETERAIGYLEQASQLEGAPTTTPFVLGWFLDRRRRLLGERANDEADRERQIRMLSRSLLTVDDALMRERIRTELERLGAEDSVASTARVLEEKFQSERSESPLSFLPADLWTTTAIP